MPNSFDFDPRGPSNARLFFLGTCFLLVATMVVWLAVAKSKGDLDSIVRVSAALVNVGDGLPEKSDVKYQGVLVGQVSTVDLIGGGRPNVVHIDLKPEYAVRIPATVTARVVPSNVFAVSSVQLVDNAPRHRTGSLAAGAVIPEDTSLPTVLFQSTLTKLRQVLNAAAVRHTEGALGVLAAISEATHGRGDAIRTAGGDLKSIVEHLNSVVSDQPGPSTLSALADATSALRSTAPDLLDALDSSLSPLRVFNETRSSFSALLSGGLSTSETLADAFDHQTSRMIAITTQLTPVVGVLADNAQFQPMFGRVQRLADRLNLAFDRSTNNFTLRAVLSLTPFRQYVRADCPRYGALTGPSCLTAPEVPTAPALYPALGSVGVTPPNGVTDNRINLAPPRDSTRHAGEVPGGPSEDNSPPSTPPPAPSGQPAPAAGTPSTNPEPAPAGDTTPRATVIGGNIGPVGSAVEVEQLSRIVGYPANTATELLLGPVVRGTTVHLGAETGTHG